MQFTLYVMPCEGIFVGLIFHYIQLVVRNMEALSSFFTQCNYMEQGMYQYYVILQERLIVGSEVIFTCP